MYGVESISLFIVEVIVESRTMRKRKTVTWRMRSMAHRNVRGALSIERAVVVGNEVALHSEAR